MSMRRYLGRRGEDLACDYFLKKGFVVLHRNFRCAIGEIDLIVQKGDFLVFVEVKTRADGHSWPEEAVDRVKLRKIEMVAEYFLVGKRGLSLPQKLRIDVLAVRLDIEGNVGSIRHFKDVTN